jgi:hypothetical protein
MRKIIWYVVFIFLILFFIPGCVSAPEPGINEDVAPLPDPEDLTEEIVLEEAEDEAAEEDTSEEAAGVLLVVYSIDGSLMLSVGFNAPVVLTEGFGDFSPIISPDGSMVLFKRSAGLSPAGINRFDLWAVNLDGSEAHLVVAATDLPGEMGEMMGESDPVLFDRLPYQIAWLPDGSGVVFNTMLAVDYGEITFYDLWVADLESGAVTQVIADGQGGNFAFSPDGSKLMVADSTSVSIFDASFENPRQLLTYPFVNTASEFAFTPIPVWAPDGSYALVAIPDPAMGGYYNDDIEAEIWQLPLTGEARLASTFNGFYLDAAMSGVMFSPDGLHFAYHSGSYMDGTVYISTLEGEIVNSFDSGVEVLGWSTDGSLITLYADSPYLAGLERAVEELPMHEETYGWWALYKWVGPTTYVGLDFSYFLEETVLWVTEIDGSSRIIDYGAQYFDALIIN